MRVIRPVGVILSAVLLLSCSDPSAPRTPASIIVTAGADQTGAVTELLAHPVVVEVKDLDGNLVRGASVTWTVTSGGGTVSTPGSTTDGSGRAQVQWTVGSVPGQNRMRVAVDGVAPVVVTAMALAGPPAFVSIVSGNDQTGLQDLPLGDGLVVAVHDAHGNGVPNIPVSFTAGVGMVIPAINTTDVNGAAGARWTPSAAGEQTLTASASGVSGQVVFTAMVLPASAVTQLQNDTAVSGISAAGGEDRYYRITVPSNAARLNITMTGGPGDADLYVRQARLPTAAVNDCQSTSPTATEECIVLLPDAGDWYLLVNAFTAYSNLTLRASYVIGGSMVIDVSGLPQGTGSDIRIRGPNRFERHITASTVLTGLIPGTYALTTNFVTDGTSVYVPTPEMQDVNVAWDSPSNVSVVYAQSAGGLNLDIPLAYITQAVQRQDGSIPLVAGRDGLLRVFARGNAISSDVPSVRARIYHAGALVETITIPAPATTVPINHDEGTLASTWNVSLPGSLIQPGMSMLIDVDPDNDVTETDETDNHFPESGTPLALTVRAAAILHARLVPVVQSNGTQGDVTTANMDTYVTDAQALYPLPGIDVDVRAPYAFTGVLPSLYDSVWVRLLSEVNALRVAEDQQRYYYGVIKPAYSQGGTGLGYIGQRAAIGVDWTDWRALTLAHEWGHNFGRLHVDCGGPSVIDQNYPYEGGRMGHHGYDMRTNQIVNNQSHYDLMSYCRPIWSSDYTYEAVLFFRGTQAGAAGGMANTGAASSRAGASAERTLLVWGRISPEGVVLEPSFEITAQPALPRAAGPYRVTGTNAQGTRILDVPFDAYEIDHMPGVRLFAYAIPLSAMGGSAPVEIRLHGAGSGDAVRRRIPAAGAGDDVRAIRDGDRVRLQWNAERMPVLMVRDERSGEIISFARGGDAQLTTTAAEVEINMSDGVTSTVRRIPVRR
ncbi:MAG: pre-peptidase C-terminal domain-containing protein [Gemmatimonadetes bacterium]|nr:pre-peptidase C-terminal domain-containing protein [Gemmatimonadota bacterium]